MRHQSWYYRMAAPGTIEWPPPVLPNGRPGYYRMAAELYCRKAALCLARKQHALAARWCTLAVRALDNAARARRAHG